MRFRETWDALVRKLQNSAGDIGADAESINRGKPGQMPQSAPFVLVFAAPAEPDPGQASLNGNHLMRVDIFCGSKPEEDASEAILGAYEMAEACARSLPNNIISKVERYNLGFDTIYADYAVAYATLYIIYEPDL
jgi:hypothetical protein